MTPAAASGDCETQRARRPRRIDRRFELRTARDTSRRRASPHHWHHELLGTAEPECHGGEGAWRTIQRIAHETARARNPAARRPRRGCGGRSWTLGGRCKRRSSPETTTEQSAEQAISRSPLTDSNRRPPPYHTPGCRLAERAARVRGERTRASRRTGAARPAVGFVCQMLAPTEQVLSCGSMGSRSSRSKHAAAPSQPTHGDIGRAGADPLAMLLCSRREAVPAADLGSARAASGALLVQMLHAHTNAAT
jgi:hypothetical protein